jgi:hypothetical protein
MHIATFSEVPCWTRSAEINEIRYSQYVCRAKLTRVGLYTSGYLSCSHIIEEGNILTQNGLEIVFSQSLGTDLSGMYPYQHVGESAEKHGSACNR